MWIKGRGRNAWCVLARSSSAKGKAGPSVRPDKSQSPTVAASRPGPSGEARGLGGTLNGGYDHRTGQMRHRIASNDGGGRRTRLAFR